MDHPFLPRLYNVAEGDRWSCLLTEFCPDGDLHVLRQRQPHRRFSEAGLAGGESGRSGAAGVGGPEGEWAGGGRPVAEPAGGRGQRRQGGGARLSRSDRGKGEVVFFTWEYE